MLIIFFLAYHDRLSRKAGYTIERPANERGRFTFIVDREEDERRQTSVINWTTLDNLNGSKGVVKATFIPIRHPSAPRYQRNYKSTIGFNTESAALGGSILSRDANDDNNNNNNHNETDGEALFASGKTILTGMLQRQSIFFQLMILSFKSRLRQCLADSYLSRLSPLTSHLSLSSLSCRL